MSFQLNIESMEAHRLDSLGVINGVILTLVFALALSYSFLNLDAYWLAWIAYVPLLLAVQNSSFKQTVIYGLVFATFLTLVIVPVMYLLSDNIAQGFSRVAKRVS